jgi:galactokinase
VVVHSGQARTLERSAYAARRAECEAASRGLGPLGRLRPGDGAAVPDPLVRRRARHVAGECERVRGVVAAFGAGDLVEAGSLMTASHRSLADDFEVSTPALDALVAWLVVQPGVFGARLTGAGFGGCVVALTEPGALDLDAVATPAWRVRAAGAATVVAHG